MADQPKKLTTAEILAKARAEKAAAAAAAAPAPVEAAPEPVAEAAPAPTAAEAPAAKPKSTADILAAARAQAAAKAAGAPAAEKAAPAAAPAAAAPGAKPKSTADILAAARAAKAGGAAAAPAPAGEAKAAPAVKAAPKGPALTADGKKPSVEEMLAAVRGDKAAAAASAAPAKPALPPTPVKPAPKAAKGKAADEDRRFALIALLTTPFALAWVFFSGTSAIAGLAVLRFMLPNVLTEPPSKFKVGPASDFDLNTVSEKFKASNGVWIVHTDKYKGKNLIYALASVCTHLGCTPSWLEGEQKYKCPCHGSGFYINGINFEGPAPRPLERVGIRIAEDGMLEVDKSVKFQEELGQWNDAASFVDASLV